MIPSLSKLEITAQRACWRVGADRLATHRFLRQGLMGYSPCMPSPEPRQELYLTSQTSTVAPSRLRLLFVRRRIPIISSIKSPRGTTEDSAVSYQHQMAKPDSARTQPIYRVALMLAVAIALLS